MMHAEPPSPPLRLEISRPSLVANWWNLNRHSGKARAGAAVKANGYGLGAEVVTKAFSEAGCRDFFVAYSSEGAVIAPLVDPASISVLHGPLSAEDAAYIAATRMRPVINSLRQAALWLEAGGGPCDIMVDTGINRLGLAMTELGDPLLERLNVFTLMSHLSCADEDSPTNEVQRRRWLEACAQIPSRDTSLANSAGISLGEAYHGTLTRPGLSLFGGIPRDDSRICIFKVANLQAMVMQVRKIDVGDSIGYNATFTAGCPMRIGVVALGYADGYLRAWSDKGTMLETKCLWNPRHQPFPLRVLGRVSMDMTVIDLTGAPDLQEGDWVEVEYDLRQAAASSGLSQYELLTLLGSRFSR